MPPVAYRRPAYRRTSDVPILNRDSPLAQGLRSWIPANNPTSNREIVTGQVGTLLSPVWSPKPGIGWMFDLGTTGEDRRMTFSGTAFGSFDVPLTLSFWRISQPSGTAQGGVLGNDSTEDAFRFVTLFAWNTTDGRIIWDYHDFSNGRILQDLWDGLYGVLTHVTLVAVPNVGQKTYINGTLRHSDATCPSSADVPTSFILGRSFDQSCSGLISDVAIWRRELSPTEIWSLYAPDTRWDLYWQPRIMVGVIAAAAPAVVLGQGLLLSRERNRLVKT